MLVIIFPCFESHSVRLSAGVLRIPFLQFFRHDENTRACVFNDTPYLTSDVVSTIAGWVLKFCVDAQILLSVMMYSFLLDILESENIFIDILGSFELALVGS